MAMQTHVMNMMVRVAPAKTTQRPPPVSAALRVTGRTATGNRYAHAKGYFKYSFSALIKAIFRNEKQVCDFVLFIIGFWENGMFCALLFSVPSAKTPSMARRWMGVSATVSLMWTQSAALTPHPKPTASMIPPFATCPRGALCFLLHSQSSLTWTFGSPLTLPLVRWRCMCPTLMTLSLWMWTGPQGFIPSRLRRNQWLGGQRLVQIRIHLHPL